MMKWMNLNNRIVFFGNLLTFEGLRMWPRQEYQTGTEDWLRTLIESVISFM